MVSLIALAIVALLPAAALGNEPTCDASNPEKCMSQGGSAQGNSLLQSVQIKGRAADVHEEKVEGRAKDVHEEKADEQQSQLQENFDELEKHAQLLTERLQFLQEGNAHADDPAVVENYRLEPELEDKVHNALAKLQQAQKEIKTIRGKHAALIQSPTQADETRKDLLESMKNVRKLAEEAGEVLSEVDESFNQKALDHEALLQDDSEEVHEEEDEEDDEVDSEEDGEEDGEEDSEEEDEDEDHEEDEEDEGEHEGEHEDEGEHDEHGLIQEDHGDESETEEPQKGTGVQYEGDNVDIERH